MKKVYITQRVELIKDIGERRDALSQEWAELAAACGFLPVPVPNHPETVGLMLGQLRPDGIILSGGNDLAAYGGNAPERDETERELIKYSLDSGTPLLGVCRGMQMLLDYFGTPLERVESHVRTHHTLSNGRHVNSFHSWGSRKCAAPLVAAGCSEDGVIEELAHDSLKNIKGVMWHPERYSPLRESDIAWIRGFFGS